MLVYHKLGTKNCSVAEDTYLPKDMSLCVVRERCDMFKPNEWGKEGIGNRPHRAGGCRSRIRGSAAGSA